MIYKVTSFMVFNAKTMLVRRHTYGETKQPIHKRMYQHRRASARQESTTLPFTPTSMPLNTLLRTKTLLHWTQKINGLKGVSKKPSTSAGKIPH